MINKLYLLITIALLVSLVFVFINTKTTNTNCQVSDWSDWGNCSQPCGSGGIQTRTRTIVKAPSGNGASCPSIQESQSCNESVACKTLTLVGNGVIVSVRELDSVECISSDDRPEYVDIGNPTEISGNINKAQIIAAIKGTQNAKFGVYLKKAGTNTVVVLGRTSLNTPDGETRNISIIFNVNGLASFGIGDKFGVFIDNVACDGGSVINPVLIISYG